MHVKILRLGSATRECDIPAGSTVSDALQKAELHADGYSVSVNGMGSGIGAELNDHDIVTLVPKVEGGC